MFNTKRRVKLIQKSTYSLKYVEVESFSTLMLDFARGKNVYNIIRGLRTTTDFEYELQMSYANSSLDKNLNTVFFLPSLENAFVSSSIVRELIKFNGDFSHLVPKEIIKDIKKEVKKQCM